MVQFFMGFQWKTTKASRCEPNSQTHLVVRLLSANRFPLLRLEVKYKMFNRLNAGKIMTIKKIPASAPF